MKAIHYRHYGSPDVLHLEETEMPTAKDNEVLLRVRAASVNPLDWHFMRGTPYLVQLVTGLGKPKSSRLGVDVAGQIEAVGEKVVEFGPGDEVFGTCRGAFAEYVCIAESTLAKKPKNLTFEQAASIPIAAFTALQSLRKGNLQPGQNVLVNGAAGGVGTYAVQVAKAFGAEVTGVCSTRNVEMVRSIGADHVIDYSLQNFTRNGQRYDLILDLVANHPLSALGRVLKPKGRCVAAGGSSDRWMIGPLTRAFRAALLSMLGSRKQVGLLAKANKEDLLTLQKLIEAGKVMPVIERRYQLREVPQAIRYLEEGHARGKVVVSVE